MNTNFDDATFFDPEQKNNSDIVDTQDFVTLDETPEREIPWKQLSIGGAFGLLLGGGSLYATGVIKGDDDSDALMAGAEAGGDINVDSLQTDNDPILLDENGNPVNPLHINRSNDDEAANNNVADSTNLTASHAQAAETTHNNANNASGKTVIEEEIEVGNHSTSVRNHDADPSQFDNGEAYHVVNLLDMDDSLSFAQAFAQARAELGAGGAFYWRGGVFGTYYEAEWNAMSPSEQSEFSQIAMNTAYNNMDALYMAHKHSTVHFSEGDVIDLSTGQHYVDDVAYITADKFDNDDVEIIDNIDVDDNGGQQIVSFDDSMEDLLTNIIDDVRESGLVEEGTLGDVATLINAVDTAFDSTGTAINDISNLIDTVDDVFGTDDGYSTDDSPSSFDDIPDYVSDADTMDIV